MEPIVERCAGLDVHKDTVMATVRVPDGDRRRRQETRRFGTMTREVGRLGDWLAGLGVTRVGMEATGVYWKPVFYGLEDRFGDVVGYVRGAAGPKRLGVRSEQHQSRPRRTARGGRS